MHSYPESRRDGTVDELHGQPVADPYRWLEDPDSAETKDWVERQRRFTSDHLDQLPDRPWFRSTMEAVVARPRAGVPRRRSGRYLVARNDGTQDQDVWYVADSVAELVAGGRVLVDPNTFSTDGTSSLTSLTVSPDGRLAAYGRSDGGSDWETFHLLEIDTGVLVEDAEIQTKFSVVEWLPDNRSYLYTAFAHEGHAAGTQTDALPPPALRLHRIGTPVTDDELVCTFPESPRLILWAEVTDDDRYAVVSLVEGTENVNRLWVYPIESAGGGSRLGAVVKVVDEPVAAFTLVRSAAPLLYLRTDLDAERGRIVAVDVEECARTGSPSWRPVLEEQEAPLDQAVAAGTGFVAVHLVDVQPRLTRYALDGAERGVVDVHGGAVVDLQGRAGEDEVFVGFSSVTSPTTTFRIDAGTGEVRPMPELIPAGAGSLAPEVRQERAEATSRDGTRVPYWLITPADADRSQPRPTLLWATAASRSPSSPTTASPGPAGWRQAAPSRSRTCVAAGSSGRPGTRRAGCTPSRTSSRTSSRSPSTSTRRGRPHRLSSRSTAPATAVCWWGRCSPSGRT